MAAREWFRGFFDNTYLEILKAQRGTKRTRAEVDFHEGSSPDAGRSCSRRALRFRATLGRACTARLLGRRRRSIARDAPRGATSPPRGRATPLRAPRHATALVPRGVRRRRLPLHEFRLLQRARERRDAQQDGAGTQTGRAPAHRPPQSALGCDTADPQVGSGDATDLRAVERTLQAANGRA